MKKFCSKELIELYSKTELISNVQILPSPPSNYTKKGNWLEGVVTVLGSEYHLTIFINEKFPLEKPLYLIDINLIGFTPHVGYLGDVCYSKDEGVFWDYTYPYGILRESLAGVIRTLKEGISTANKLDLISEFEYYWEANISVKNKYNAYLHADLKDKACAINLYEFSKVLFIGQRNHDLINYYGFDQSKFNELMKSSNALYIPLKDNALLYPPNYTEFWNSSDIYQIIEQQVSSKNKLLIENILSKKRDIDSIIFRLKQPNGSFAFFGVKYTNIVNKKLSPILHIKVKSTLIPIVVKNRSKEYLTTRGGGNTELANKNVAIIGCGSLGGYIAPELLKSGISKLTLIDNDIFESENIYRHYLGREYAGKYKSEALSQDLEKKIPYVKITSINKKVEDLISEENGVFKNYDLVIVATGNPTINLFLNKYFHENFRGLPVIFTWLDPYGIGGHSLLTNNNSSGCYDCLYDDMHNKASFAKKGQTFSKSISGCGSLFTPFGSLDSTETALSAVRLSLNVLLGKEKQNPIISWKGEPDAFLKEGFSLSDRFSQTPEELFNNRNSYFNENCEVCRKNN